MPDFLCGEKIRGGSVRTREQQVIQVKFCPSSRDTTLNCIPFQLGKGYVRARYRWEGCCTSTMLKKRGGGEKLRSQEVTSGGWAALQVAK